MVGAHMLLHSTHSDSPALTTGSHRNTSLRTFITHEHGRGAHLGLSSSVSCHWRGSKYAEMPAGVVSKDDSIGSPRAFSACAAAVQTSTPHSPCVHLQAWAARVLVHSSSAQAPEFSLLGHIWCELDAFGSHGAFCGQILIHYCLHVLI